QLDAVISELFAREESQYGLAYFDAFDEFKAALNEGRIRAAEPDPSSPTGWKVNAWVKKGILLGFRIGRIVEMPERRSLPGHASSAATVGETQFRDKHTYPLKKIPLEQNVRVVPGAVLAAGTILTGSTPVYDLVRDAVYRRESAIQARSEEGRGGKAGHGMAEEDARAPSHGGKAGEDARAPGALMIPPGAVVVP